MLDIGFLIFRSISFFWMHAHAFISLWCDFGNCAKGIGFGWMSEKASDIFPDILFIWCMHLHMSSYPPIWFFHTCTNIRINVLHALRAFYFFYACTSIFLFAQNNEFFVNALRTSAAYISGDYFFKGNEFFVHALLSGIAYFSGDYFFKGKGRPFFYPVESTRPCSSPPLSLVFNRQRKT